MRPPAVFTALRQVRNTEDLLRETVRFAHSLGFSDMGMMTVVDRPDAEPVFCNLTTVIGKGYSAHGDREAQRADPVMQHCRLQSTPLLWDQMTYVEQRQGALWEEQAAFGLKAGAAWALHLPRGRHVFLGLERDQPLPHSHAERRRILHDLQLFTAAASDLALHLLVPEGLDTTRGLIPELEHREKETLLSIGDGLSFEDIGKRFCLSGEAVQHTIRNLVKKLGCVSENQAYLQALRLGLIS